MGNGIWTRSDFEDDGEVLYFFHPTSGSGGQAYVVMYADGTVEFKGDRKLVIKNAGSGKEKVIVEDAADLVIG
jgi:hypothetical protein